MKKGFFSPTILLILALAFLMDIISILLTLTGLGLLSFINGFFAFLLGALMFIETGSKQKKGENNWQKTFKRKIFKKLGLSFIIEIIPIIGGFLPVWTWSAYKQIKN